MTKDKLMELLLVERYAHLPPPPVAPDPVVRAPAELPAPPPPVRRRHLRVVGGDATTTAAA
ncbi:MULTISPECIES: hypothetical protein [Micromonospora]|uniref:hypothetical protein n=1 Tax=Micromonospora TaxID=1873 RepID=UPI0004C38C35|nr:MULTISPECIES: hypothetical protein [Micromonospora]MDG4756299.1 hypothetical protein [Micromonospora sp. WMMD710]MDG4762442.1 hypothetical protein [Micromonospora sp. WMMD710]MDG4762477.1 hypothetical protein [Micromonospora sp. WMMD710]